jgi:hypothetical protein
MTTLRRALKAPFKGASIKALAALLCAALVLCVAQPALAAPHGGGGGGHAGGGGGHGAAHGTAHPVGGGHYVGPYRGFGGRGFGGRGFGGRGFFPGRGFGFYGFPGFGFGLGLGLGFAWDYPWAWGPGYYGYWGGYPGYGYDWPYYYGYQTPPAGDDGGYNPGGEDGAPSANPPQAAPARPGPRDGRAAMGAINLDLSPADAQVYLNGEYVGHVRDFGGWSHGYLWLEKGTYDIVFYRDGYKTLARQVTIYPGLIITWDDKMEHGQAIRPEDLPTKTHERRDARIQFESDRAAQIDAQQAAAAQEPPPYNPPAAAPDSGGGWRSRVDSDRNGASQPQGYARPAPAPAPQQVAGDTVDTLSHLHLKIEPADASVYLDGRFVGTGSDLAANDEGLVVAPGRHKLAVVRPGRMAKERSFTATAGNDVNLTVALAAVQAAP